MAFILNLTLSIILSIIATLILWQFQNTFNLNWFWTIVIGFAIGFLLSYFISALLAGDNYTPATVVVV